MVLDLEIGSGLSNIRNQIFAALIGSYIILCHGCNIAWLSPTLPLLLSNNTPLASGPLTYEELSNVGAAPYIGAICGSLITGLLSVWFGSRRAMAFLALPVITFWIFIHFGDHFYHILLARLITGIPAGGLQPGVILFISEISNDNIRGRLGSLVYLFRNLGTLIGFIGGALIKYEHRPFVFILLPISFSILVFFLPDTPQHHLKMDNFEKAEKSLMYYKGWTGKSDGEKSLLKAEFERLKLVQEEQKNNPKLRLSDFCNRMAFKGILICIAMSWFVQVSGCIVLTGYASLIFKISGSTWSVDASAISMSIFQIIGGLVSTQLGDAFGRKTTLFISLLGSALGLSIFSLYLYLHHLGYQLSNYMWLPVVSLSFVSFISSAGIMALGSTCIIENFSTKIRPAGMVFSAVMNSICIFIVTKSLPILLEIIYLHGYMLLLAVNCGFGLIFVAFMTETKGKTLDILETTQSK